MSMIGADFRPLTEIDLINPMYEYNKSLKKNAQALRREMTREERIIWYDLLKRLPYPAKRQFNIENYIVDFYIPSKKIVVEIDGSQHYTAENKKADEEREKALSKYGIKIIRYDNHDINKNMDRVTSHLLNILGLEYEELKKQG